MISTGVVKLATTSKALGQGEAGGCGQRPTIFGKRRSNPHSDHGFLHRIKQFYPDAIRIPIRPNPLVFDHRNWIYVSQYTPMAEANR